MMTKRLLLLTLAPLSLRDDESADDFVDASPHLLRLSSVGTAAVVATPFCRSLLLLIVAQDVSSAVYPRESDGLYTSPIRVLDC